ncbi:MAG: BTAD domain-containing putative transcriptional regulator [Pseudomonadota bacterium]
MTVGTGSRTVKIGRATFRVIALLYLSNAQSVAREQIAGTVWPDLDERHARKSLNTELWRSRQKLAQADCDPDLIFASDSTSIGLSCPLDAIDAYRFAQLLKEQVRLQTSNADRVNPLELEAAIEIYRGDFLEGHYDDDWLLQHRNYLCGRFQAALNMLFEISMQRQNFAAALEVGQRMLAFDPLQEHVHRGLIVCHLRLGDRRSAQIQYRECKALLRDELGVEPMAETTAALALKQQSVKIQPVAQKGIPWADKRSCLHHAALQLDSARALVRQAMAK